MEQKLLTFPEYQSSPLVFSGVCVTQSLVFSLEYCGSLLGPFSFGHFIVCSSPIYGFWLLFFIFNFFLDIL
jgi:hypothetical protein